MPCKEKAILQFSKNELEFIREIISSNDTETALKVITKIGKRIDEFIEPS